ncbi:(Fe-S)-binding protein [Desulfitibacter alkalitolerans]|uniref:(Fe-S)-binding protein n=1 Tax=Desulfitibacter alkalitolerans TaxID=264641 RepID=UPI0004868E59|nr:(Fe-S)-binding protein [Desulfitibacter alkalitolerans]
MVAELEREVIRCIKCGACQSVCPIYKELKTEASVARGKVGLIRAVIKGDMDMTETLSERMYWCLLCKACVESCPSGVKVDSLVVGARSELVNRKGLPLVKKAIFKLGLKNPRLFNLGLNMSSLVQGVLFKRTNNGQGMLPRIPMGLDKRRVLKPLAGKSFRAGSPARFESPGAKATAAFFTGCMINYVYPEVGEAVVKVLEKNKVNILIPTKQHCCGTPVYTSGDTETAKLLMKQTIDTLYNLKVDAIITACGSCGLSLKKEYLEYLKDSPEYLEKARIVSQKAVDFSKFMADIGMDMDLKELNNIVTYHESCHLTRGQGVKSEPRQLMARVPGLKLKEMKNPGYCCGSAGSFSLSYYDLSMKINTRKTEDIAHTGADTLVTGCPACMMHINDGLTQKGLDIKVMHTAELLAKAIK